MIIPYDSHVSRSLAQGSQFNQILLNFYGERIYLYLASAMARL